MGKPLQMIVQECSKYAVDLSLNSANFNPCFDSKKYESKISKNLQEGYTNQVSGIQIFYIGNDKKGHTQMPGDMSFPSFKLLIDQQLTLRCKHSFYIFIFLQNAILRYYINYWK